MDSKPSHPTIADNTASTLLTLKFMFCTFRDTQLAGVVGLNFLGHNLLASERRRRKATEDVQCVVALKKRLKRRFRLWRAWYVLGIFEIRWGAGAEYPRISNGFCRRAPVPRTRCGPPRQSIERFSENTGTCSPAYSAWEPRRTLQNGSCAKKIAWSGCIQTMTCHYLQWLPKGSSTGFGNSVQTSVIYLCISGKCRRTCKVYLAHGSHMLNKLQWSDEADEKFFAAVQRRFESHWNRTKTKTNGAKNAGVDR